MRLSDEQVWDVSMRPTAPPPDGERRYTPDQRAAARHLVDVHDGLRGELERIRDLLEQVGRGAAEPQAVRSLLTRMTVRQNNWAVGVSCQAYSCMDEADSGRSLASLGREWISTSSRPCTGHGVNGREGNRCTLLQ